MLLSLLTIKMKNKILKIKKNGCNDIVNDKIYKSSFTITGTKAQILSVKEFMVSNGIHFGKVDK